MKRITTTQWMYLLLGFFLFCFAIFYPKMLLLLDEYSYFNRGLALSQFSTELIIPDLTGTSSIDLSGSRYLPGTPLLIAFFIALLGNKSVFLIGAFCFAISTFLMIKVLEKLKLNPLGILFFFTFPPLLMLTRTVMSGMPSLLCTSLFLYLLICKSKSRWQYFLLALIVGLATLFRETNILVFGFFGLSLFWTEKKWLGYLMAGFGIGLGSRLLLSQLIYGSYSYMSGADPFTLANVLPNLTLYSLLGLVLLPLGLWQVLVYQGKYKWEIKLAVLAFFGLYLSYGYNPVEYSGLAKGLLFGGRFLVPLLPLFVIAAGYFINQYKWLQNKYVQGIFIAAGFFAVLGSQYAGDRYNSTHYAIGEKIYTKYKEFPLVMDHSGYTSINRYINPLVGFVEQQADLNRFEDADYARQVLAKHPKVYIAVSMRFENAEKQVRAGHFKKILDELDNNYSLNKVESLNSFDGTTVEVWEMSAR